MSGTSHFGHPPSALLSTLLNTITTSIIPLTAPAVARGCKVFGASILHKPSLSIITSSTNNELTSPLLHGEVSTLLSFHSLPPASRPKPEECIFLSTHEPCSLCLSAITWSGFDNFYYLFSYEDTREEFGIPHDIRILEEVFPSREEGLYRRNNAFWSAYSLEELVRECKEEEREGLRIRMEDVKREYRGLNETYQASKGGQLEGQIPLN